ncbi:hypothetical protein GE115_10235 [Agromyces sp. CFH 90414]|uniref:Uncharacterized protein n=1 Tax=Agromyces agglutinans TaxID=2662258 RepID=A0A6I2F6A9_9MICO|nr:hypothetical protein [Agromyces agglutinans]MRG60242.1 hypothetical protein [Agromyces agglutinans]
MTAATDERPPEQRAPGERVSEAPGAPAGRLARMPMPARVAAALALAAGAMAAIVALNVGVGTAGAQPASAESLCRTAIESTLESRGHADVRVAQTMRVTQADDAHRVSGSVASVDEAGRTDHAAIRCVVRGDGDAMRVVSARLSD